jgi:hypothetical protein
MASMLEAFIFGILFFLFFKVVVVQDKGNTHEDDSAANVVNEPFLPAQHANNELVQTV